MFVFERIQGAFKKFPQLRKGLFPESVNMVEVGPRDGLQYESNFVDTNSKAEFIDLQRGLTKARMPVIECTSFISAQYAPQLADQRMIASLIQKDPATTKYQVVAPNRDAVRMAKDQSYDGIVFTTSPCVDMVSNSMKCSLSEQLGYFKDVCLEAEENSLSSRAYISCCMGSPANPDIDPLLVNDFAHQLLEMGCYQISLADNVALGDPHKTFKLMESISPDIIPNISVHFHDTKYLAVDNILVALSHGISNLDASVSGLGQCTHHNSQLGNVPTEDIVFVLECMGIKHGLKVKWLLEAGDFISEKMTRENLCDAFDVDFFEDILKYKDKYSQLLLDTS